MELLRKFRGRLGEGKTVFGSFIKSTYPAFILDLGALGIQIPQITSARMAEFCIKAARFFPKG